jgi:hypothetical protein
MVTQPNGATPVVHVKVTSSDDEVPACERCFVDFFITMEGVCAPWIDTIRKGETALVKVCITHQLWL